MKREIEKRILDEIPDATVTATVEGNRATLKVISGAFADLSRVQRQQRVYKCISDLISDGSLHAVTILAHVE
jgi:acid stress-induced BolA-like protein IbaG/YrbA